MLSRLLLIPVRSDSSFAFRRPLSPSVTPSSLPRLLSHIGAPAAPAQAGPGGWEVGEQDRLLDLTCPLPLSLLSWLVILSHEDAFSPSLLLSLSPDPALLVFIVSLLWPD